MTVDTPGTDAPAQDDLATWKAEARKWEARAKANAEEAKTALADLATLTTAMTAIEADLAEFKTRAETAEKAVAEHDAEAAKAAEEADREALLKEVAETANVPAAALRGSTREELLAHAETLKPLLTGVGTVIPDQGASPEHAAESEARTVVSALFTPGVSD